MPCKRKTPVEDGTESWAKNEPAYTLCRMMIEEGQLTGKESPSKVREMNDVFRKITKRSFRAGWGRLKAELGLTVKNKAKKIVINCC